MNIKTKITNKYGTFYLMKMSYNSAILFSEYCGTITLSMNNDVDRDIFLYAWTENDETFFKKMVFVNQKYHYCKNKYSKCVLQDFPTFIEVKALYELDRCPSCNAELNNVNVYPIQSQKSKITITPLVDEISYNDYVDHEINMWVYAISVKGKRGVISSELRKEFNSILISGLNANAKTIKLTSMINYTFMDYLDYLISKGTFESININILLNKTYEFETYPEDGITLFDDENLNSAKPLNYSPKHNEYLTDTDYKILSNTKYNNTRVIPNKINIIQYPYKDLYVNTFKTNDIVYYRLMNKKDEHNVDTDDIHVHDITILDKMYELKQSNDIIGIYDIAYDSLVIISSMSKNRVSFNTLSFNTPGSIIGEATFDYVKMEVMSKFTNLIIQIKGKNKDHSIIKKIKNGIKYNNKCLRCGSSLITSLHTCSDCGSNVTIKYQYQRFVDQLNNDNKSTIKIIQDVLRNNKNTK